MMVTKAQIYQEELLLIDQIKELIKTRSNFRDPNNYLVPLKVNKYVTRYEHKERKKKLEEILLSLQEIIRIERDLIKKEKKESSLDQIMDLIYDCTESKGEDQDIYLKSQISQILNRTPLK